MDHTHTSHHHHHLPPASLWEADPLATAGFVVIMSFSFFASLHCAAMCAPLACAQLGKRARLSDSGIWLYNLGRSISYPLAGAAFGFIGAQLGHWSESLGMVLSVAIGTILMFAAIVLAFQKSDIFKRWSPPVAAQRVALKLTRPWRRLSSSFQDFALGFITVLLPCATLTPALLAAAGTQDPVAGASFLLAFLIGTLPVMLIAPIMPGRLALMMPSKVIPKVVALFLFLAGMITVLRGWH